VLPPAGHRGHLQPLGILRAFQICMHRKSPNSVATPATKRSAPPAMGLALRGCQVRQCCLLRDRKAFGAADSARGAQQRRPHARVRLRSDEIGEIVIDGADHGDLFQSRRFTARRSSRRGSLGRGRVHSRPGHTPSTGGIRFPGSSPASRALSNRCARPPGNRLIQGARQGPLNGAAQGQGA